MDLKKLFEQTENGLLDYDTFTELLKSNNIKLADLNEGGYVSKNKFETELGAKVKEIELLNGSISTRDSDLVALKKKLEEAGTDATKLTDLTTQLENLKGQYDTDTKAFKEQLKKQAYEFAVKEFASKQNFSSQAAKRDFIQTMISRNLKLENDAIQGADDFVKEYTQSNEDAFITEYTPEENDEEFVPENAPHFVGSTPGAEDSGTPDPTGGFLSAFHFTPVRPMPNN